MKARRVAVLFALAVTLGAQTPGMDLDTIRSRALRYAQLSPASRAQAIGEDLGYAGLHPEAMPGGHLLVRFSGPHLGEDPDVIAVPLDWPDRQEAGARAVATLAELARVLRTRHFRPQHGLWLLWANFGSEGMNGLLASQAHQGKLLAHLLILEGGWTGLSTASEGRLAMELQFPAVGARPEALKELMAPAPGVRMELSSLPDPSRGGRGLLAELFTADPAAFRGLEASLRSAATQAGATAMGVRESLGPASLQGGATHPLAAWVAAQARMALGAAPAPVGPRGGAMAATLARGVPTVALGLGAFEGARPADLVLQLAEGMQDLP